MSNTSAPGANSKQRQKPKTHPLLEHREGGSTARAVPWKKESRGQAGLCCLGLQVAQEHPQLL